MKKTQIPTSENLYDIKDEIVKLGPKTTNELFDYLEKKFPDIPPNELHIYRAGKRIDRNTDDTALANINKENFQVFRIFELGG